MSSSLCCELSVDGVHLSLKFFAFFVTDGWYIIFFPRELDPFCNCRRNLTIWQAHAVAGVICYKPCLFPSWMMAVVIASDDAPCLPELNLIQKLAPWYSDFAYEQLIKVVGV